MPRRAIARDAPHGRSWRVWRAGGWPQNEIVLDTWEQPWEPELADMIGEVDCQGDARVNRDEFLEMMCNF